MTKNHEGLWRLYLSNKSPYKFTVRQRRRFILYGRQERNAFKFIVTQFHLLKTKVPYTNYTLKKFSESS